ncbi:filamentous hemagglutinin N-terminal domain-containing protein, partial [Bordetella hinzii]|uniref:two-partner secretion domain-containing protein n=1 Tax=Bordetella hinzii TaxID=103855 RepID=UPI0039FBFF4B
MNKHCYRLRFHHRTAQLIPVAEIHTASSRGGTRRSRPRRGLAALPLAGLLLASPAPAQIVPADNQASTVTIAPNGVPVINIAAPDASGLSHNRFSHLNVTPPGAVFNNSKLDGRSQLAGYILKNPRLGSGPQAASILAEVTSPGPASRLGGTLEVFGRPGQLIIANPNGISVNGLSTLNIHALTLSTGSTQGADAWSLHTRQGRIDIDSDGVNTDGLSSFDLIARYINIHGPIGPLRSGAPARLGLHAGASRHDLKDGQTLPQPSTASARPAISASALGAMHGAHIRLEVTDSGAGVRLQGALLSSSDITIHANGAVLLANSTARRDTLVTAGSDVHLAEAGGILTGQALKITTSGQIQTGGKIQAGTLQVQAASLSQTAGLIDVQGGPGQLAAMITLKNAYQVGAAPAGLQVRRGNARIQAATLDNRGLITTTDGDLELKIADTLLNRGRIDTGGLLTLSTQGSLNNAGRLQSGILELHAGSLQQTGHLETQADGHITVTTDLSNPGRIAFGGQGNIQARTLSNSGTLQAGKHLRVSSDALANSGGLSGKDLSLATTGVFSNTGQIQAGGDLDIEAADYRNSAHIAGKRLRVQTGTELVLDNHAPLATERLILAAPKIVVRAELASPASLVLQGGDGGIDNHAAIASAGGILLRTQGDIRNHDGALIWAGARLGLQGRSIFNGLHGLIHSEEDMSIKASRLLRNHAGRINSRQAMLLETPLLENLSRLSGKVSVDTSPGSGHAWFPEVKKRHHLRIVSMRIGKLNTGRAVSSLHLEQGVIHAGKNMDITPSGEGPGKVHNEGRLTADGVQRIHADVRNASLSQAMTLTDYFKHLPGPQVWAQDNLAVLNPLTQHFPTLYDLLDHIFEHYEYEKDAGWTPIFVAYKYKHSWLSDSLAGGDLQHAPLLAKALGLALGGDWRGLSDTDRARRWAEFKAGRRGQDLPFYPAQPTVLGGRLGTDIQGRVANGEHVADVQASPVDPALQQAVADAQKQWRRGPPGEPAPEAAEPAEQDAGRPDR